MSSTNRGHEREKTDYYVTPPRVVKEFLKLFLKDAMTVPISWLDPCAGGDDINGMSYADSIKELRPLDKITTIDIREDSRAEFKEDYLLSNRGGHDVVISNPPFKHAEAFIRKAMNDVHNGGHVIMLLRLNFLGSKARKPFFDEFTPKYIYVHRQRMSFTDNGQTDSIEYAHFVWQKGYNNEYSMLKII